MLIYATSDLHGNLPKIPECDLLIIAGDILPVNMSHDIISQSVWLGTVFKKWINYKVDASHIVIIGGNHDFVFELPDFEGWFSNNINACYLRDNLVEINGLKIYGTPYVPDLKNWAFYGTSEQLYSYFSRIPTDIDILVTHTPPRGINDATGKDLYEHIGSKELYDQLSYCSEELGRPIPVNIHGHIHEGYGYREQLGTKFYNVSHCDAYYHPVNKPVIIEL